MLIMQQPAYPTTVFFCLPQVSPQCIMTRICISVFVIYVRWNYLSEHLSRRTSLCNWIEFTFQLYFYLNRDTDVEFSSRDQTMVRNQNLDWIHEGILWIVKCLFSKFELIACESRPQYVSCAPPRASMKLSLLHYIVFHILLRRFV